MALMLVWSTPPVSGRDPSHAGLQPPSESMNASVNHLSPVAAMTSVGFCGLPQPKYSYGAAAMAPDGGGAASPTVSRSTFGPPFAVTAVARTVLTPAFRLTVMVAVCQASQF